MSKQYSEFSFAVDLIMDIYKTSNPIIIAEKALEDLEIDLNIHQISDYLSLEKEDFEKENRAQYYNIHY